MSDKVKIVMIDDEKDLCMMTKENLEAKAGFDVVTTSDAQNAINLIVEEKPDVVLLDIVMPAVKGPEIIVGMKKNAETKKIPIIVVSGKGEMVFNKRKNEFKWVPNSDVVKQRGEVPEAKGAEALAEAYGVDDYVAKPFTTDLLIQVINEVIERNRKTQTDVGEEEPEF